MLRPHLLFERLRALGADGPVVVAHRGDRVHHPENTLAAFRAARTLGVPMQEFDVRVTRDGVHVCIHDATLDRTTDAATRLGPGALVAQASLRDVEQLDAGSWFGAGHGSERVPTLASALAAMLPRCIPLIEHKAGGAPAYVAELRRLGVAAECILQSFDWSFVAAAGALAPELALAVLGPTEAFQRPDGDALAAAARIGAGMVHWEAASLDAEDVERVHNAGMLLTTYTTNDALGWCGGALLGVDAMCTDDPGGMLSLRAAGRFRAGSSGTARE